MAPRKLILGVILLHMDFTTVKILLDGRINTPKCTQRAMRSFVLERSVFVIGN